MEAIRGFYENYIRWSAASMTLSDVLEIAIFTYFIYHIILWIKQSKAWILLKGAAAIFAMYILAVILQLNNIVMVFNRIAPYVATALLVIFQPEIRRALERMGQTDQWASKLFNVKGRYNDPSLKGAWRSAIIAICDAAERFSETKTGALIVFERSVTLDEQMRSGTIINSDVTAELLKNIFYPKAPLHDGAVVIRDGRIAAAGCVLPLTSNTNLSPDLGTRHRAGIGMSENSDAVVVIVSEETGTISVAIGGLLKRHLMPETLEKLLIIELVPQEPTEQDDKLHMKLLKLLSAGKGDKDDEK